MPRGPLWLLRHHSRRPEEDERSTNGVSHSAGVFWGLLSPTKENIIRNPAVTESSSAARTSSLLRYPGLCWNLSCLSPSSFWPPGVFLFEKQSDVPRSQAGAIVTHSDHLSQLDRDGTDHVPIVQRGASAETETELNPASHLSESASAVSTAHQDNEHLRLLSLGRSWPMNSVRGGTDQSQGIGGWTWKDLLYGGNQDAQNGYALPSLTKEKSGEISVISSWPQTVRAWLDTRQTTPTVHTSRCARLLRAQAGSLSSGGRDRRIQGTPSACLSDG